MSNLKHWQDKIKEKRKKTEFRDFLKEIVSWYPFAFYKTGKLITNLPKSDRINEKILTPLEFEENRDSLMNKGLDYNNKIDFFKNFQKLFKSIPWYSLFSFNAENAEYGDNVYNSKNIYLSNGAIHDCENIFYSFYIKQNCNNIFNSFMVWDNCDNIYFGSGIIKSYNIFYSRNIYNSNNVWFSGDLTGCRECLFCDNLENKTYCIKNIQYEKDSYLGKKKEILKDKTNFYKYYKAINLSGIGPGTKNVNGRFIPFCEDLENGFFSYRVHNGRNVILMGSKDGNTHFYDSFGGGSPVGDRYYGCCWVGTYSEDLYLCHTVDYGKNMFYSYYCTTCSYCIGCIGLKNKSYCILNKQYTKEEREVLADKIFTQMDQEGILGNFFPGELNPFYFNDTMAGILGNFTKEEVESDGYMWRDEEIKVDIPEGSEIIKTSELSEYQGYNGNGEWKINPEILKKVIVDEKGNYYRIVKMEYDFLLKHGLPLPEIHWMDRMKLNFGV